MVFGPVMMLQPSAAERRQASLRKRALQLGMRMQMLALPARATDSEAPKTMPAYCMAPPGAGGIGYWILQRAAYEHELNFLKSWYWEGPPASPAEQQVLSEWLPKLPASVVGVSAGARGWCFFWEERGGEEVLEQLHNALQALAATATSSVSH
jgi:hypothetical protein